MLPNDACNAPSVLSRRWGFLYPSAGWMKPQPGSDLWSHLLPSVFSFQGAASDHHPHEHLSLRLRFLDDGTFQYETRLWDGGQAYTLESMRGSARHSASKDADHDFVLEVTSTSWQSGSWNGESR